MSENQVNTNHLLSDLYRQEYPKMTAVLCHHFGLEHIEIAEDITSETFLKASENWAIQGVPERPAAWLYTVAKNKARDYLKRTTLFKTQIVQNIEIKVAEAEFEFGFEQEQIQDSQLAMIFAICDSDNSAESQICLALQILCGFSIEEIANAFLTKTETIKKRLHRAKTRLRTTHFQTKALTEAGIKGRLDTVLKTLYLLFNEGYYSKNNDHLVRCELCAEAIRLTLILTESSLTGNASANALVALMCYQASRLEARTNDMGEIVLFDEQDQNLWNKSLIERGHYFLVNACQGNQLSNYHLEAAIAYWHTDTEVAKKWEHILHLYNQLIFIEYSPVAALNRAFALSKVYGHELAIREAEKLNLTDNDHYHNLLGYLYETIDTGKAIDHYSLAVRFTKAYEAKQVLKKKINQLNMAFGINLEE